MAITVDLVAGWTAPLDFDLLDGEDTPSGTMAGMTVALVVKNGDTQLALDNSVSVQDATNWIVRFTPPVGALVEGDYRGRFEVTDTLGKKSYFPQKQWDIWKIRSVA